VLSDLAFEPLAAGLALRLAVSVLPILGAVVVAIDRQDHFVSGRAFVGVRGPARADGVVERRGEG
jgi:hypothetical protein